MYKKHNTPCVFYPIFTTIRTNVNIMPVFAENGENLCVTTAFPNSLCIVTTSSNSGLSAASRRGQCVHDAYLFVASLTRSVTLLLVKFRFVEVFHFSSVISSAAKRSREIRKIRCKRTDFSTPHSTPFGRSGSVEMTSVIWNCAINWNLNNEWRRPG